MVGTEDRKAFRRSNNLSWRRLLFFFSLLLVCAVVIGHPVAAEDDFAHKYQTYQKAVQEGKAALEKKDFHVAIDNFTKAIKDSPFVASHYVDRGIAWYREGERQKAENDFSRAIILDPRLAIAYTYRGLVRMDGSDQEGALKDYTTALGLNPRDLS